jgi:hypothetical protein
MICTIKEKLPRNEGGVGKGQHVYILRTEFR